MLFQSPRLTFSCITHDDFEDVKRTMNDRHTCEIVSFLSWPLTDDQVRMWCDKSEDSLKQQPQPEYLLLARNKDGHPAGCIGIHINQNYTARAETGYWIAPELQGQGIASEMLSAAAQYAFNTLSLEEIFATTDMNNPASERVLTKNGFSQNGKIDVNLPGGKMRPSKLFILKKE